MFYSFNCRSALFLAMLELALFSLSFQDFHHMNGGYYNILVIIILFNYYFYLCKKFWLEWQMYERKLFNHREIWVDWKLFEQSFMPWWMDEWLIGFYLDSALEPLNDFCTNTAWIKSPMLCWLSEPGSWLVFIITPLLILSLTHFVLTKTNDQWWMLRFISKMSKPVNETQRVSKVNHIQMKL